MTRMSGIAALAVIVMLGVPSASRARHDAGLSPRGTNSAGTAQSSVQASNRGPGVTTGSAAMGSGHAATGPGTSPDAALKAENELLNRKLKGICRGC